MNNFMEMFSITGDQQFSRTFFWVRSQGLFSRLFLLIVGLGVAGTCLAEEHDLQVSNIVQSPVNPVVPGDTVSYTFTVQSIPLAGIGIQITSADNTGSIVGPFSLLATPEFAFPNPGNIFFPVLHENQPTQYTLTWQPPEGQHNLLFTVECGTNCSGKYSQSITTNVIQPSPTVNQLKPASGNLQRGTLGTTLAPFVINAFDATGNPIEGVSVDWEISTPNGGTLSQLTTITNASGQSSNTLTLGTSDLLFVKATVNPNAIVDEFTPSAQSNGTRNNSTFTRSNNPASVTFVVNGGIADQPELTRNQKSVAKALDPMCITLAEMGEGRSTEQNDLQRTCDRLETDDLAALAARLDLLAHEEVSTQGRAIIETAKLQSVSIHQRLVALRAGARGVNLSGLNIKIDGQTLPESVVTALLGGNARGGSAGDKQGIASRWGSFVNATVIVGDRDKTSQETGFNFRAEGITAGADYRISDKLVVGGALGYTGKDSDFKGNAGDMEINNWHLTAYSSYYRSDSFYLDGLLKLGKNTIDTRRRINLPGDPMQEGIGDTTGWEYAVSLNGGYEYSRNALAFGPYGRLGYIQTSINGYTETASNPGNPGAGSVLIIDNQDVDSITAVLGSQVSYAISTRNAVYLLQLNGEWEHEFRDNSRAIAAQFAYDPTRTSFDIASDSPDRNYFNLGLGVTAMFTRGRSGFFHYESRLGQDNVRQYWINGGIRIEL